MPPTRLSYFSEANRNRSAKPETSNRIAEHTAFHTLTGDGTPGSRKSQLRIALLLSLAKCLPVALTIQLSRVANLFVLAVASQVSHLASRLLEATVEKNNGRTLPETEELVTG
jgi:hypothetical protein